MFIAISGLLLLGAMAAINGSINNTRFNDAINSTTSFIQSQYGEVASGRNSRLPNVKCTDGVITSGDPSVPGMANNCVVLGRLLEFSVGGNTITSRYIVGKDTAASITDDTVAVVEADARATSASTDDRFDVPWSTQINKITQGTLGVNYLAIIRSPVSERVLFYSFGAGANRSSLDSDVIKTDNLNKEVAICLREDGTVLPRTGYIRIGQGQGQDIIRADLTSTSGDCA